MISLVNHRGISLLELLVVIVVVAILLSVAMQSMTTAVDDMRRVGTERELEALAVAITGDPSLASGGIRSDFGYVGDIGAFPPDLEALRTNPGGWSTWDGPYLGPSFLQDSTGHLSDEWGRPYTYNGGITISSTGSGSPIVKNLADHPDDYLVNTYRGSIRDADNSVPGPIYRDSISIVMSIPDGSGGAGIAACLPDSSGAFTLDSIPAGSHAVRVIYLPSVDTLLRYVTILPRHRNDPLDQYRFTGSYFTGGPGYTPGLTYVSGSAATSGGTCDIISFEIANNSGATITLSSLQLNWSSPTAFYEQVTVAGVQVYRKSSGLSGSGTVTSFSSSQTLAHGATVTVVVEKFRRTSGGGGPRVDMGNVDLTIEFSDGSTISFDTGGC